MCLLTWFASDFVTRIERGISQHLLGLLARVGGADHARPQRGTDRIGRRAKRFLSSSQKYEIWLQLVRQETTISEAGDRFEVDRSTIMRIREVARQGALEALAASKPGLQPTKLLPAAKRAALLVMGLRTLNTWPPQAGSHVGGQQGAVRRYYEEIFNRKNLTSRALAPICNDRSVIGEVYEQRYLHV
jgi:hypothetical protein